MKLRKNWMITLSLLAMLLTLFPTLTTAAAAGAPGTPTLSQSNWDNSPNYAIQFNMWWGNNGTSWKLYENGALVHTAPLSDNTPNAQSASYSFSNKASGTYEYKAELINSFGTATSNILTYTVDGGSAPPTDTQAPTAPTNLSSTAKTATSVDLSWTAATDNIAVTSYEVFNGSTSVGTTSGTSISITGLLPNTAHSFTVKAKDAAGNVSAASSPLQITTDAAPVTPADTQAPTAPGNLTASNVTGNSVMLSWTASTDNVAVTGYDIYMGPTSKSTTTTTSYLVTGLAPSTLYSFTIKAKDAAGNISSASNAVTVTTLDPSQGGDYKIIGYFMEWGVYERNFKVTDIDASKVTHINYAFADIAWNGIHGNPDPTGPNPNTWPTKDETGIINVPNGTIVIGDPTPAVLDSYPGDVNSDPIRGNFNQLNKLKQANPQLKTLISVGGWGWSNRFSDVAADPVTRSVFAKSAVTFIQKYGFDGVDLDWEYPVGGGLAGNSVRPADKQNYTLLLQEVRNELDRAGAAVGKRYLLTIAAGASTSFMNNTELAKIAQICDWINIMTYDFHGSWDTYAGQNAPLYYDPADPYSGALTFNVDAAVKGFINNGVPANNIVLGMPFYGRGLGNSTSTTDGLYQPVSGESSTGTYEAGNYDYWDLAANYVNKNGYTRYWNDVTKTPYLYNPATRTFISYDDPESILHKVNYIKSKGLGGGMFWEFSGDKTKALLNTVSDNLPR